MERIRGLGWAGQLINLSDTDTNSEHLPQLTSQTENQFRCWRGKSTVSFIQPGKGTCASARVHSKQTLPLPFQYIKQPKLDDQFISSPSWLPSPRFELRALAGYTWLFLTQNYTQGSCTLHFGLRYELIYQLNAIEYLFVYFRLLDMFRAYTPIFRSNGC